MIERGAGSGRWVQLLGLLLSIGAVGILLSAVDVGSTVGAMLQADLRLAALAAGLVGIQLVIVTGRWRLLLIGPGFELSTRRLIGPVLLGYLGNFVLPTRLGEVVRSVVVARREQRPLSEVLGSVVLERVIDVSVLAVAALGTAIALGAPAWMVNAALLVALGGTVVLAVLATPAAAALGRRLGRLRAGPLRAFGGAIVGFARGARVQDRRLAIGGAVALSAVSWLIEGSVYWLVARSLALDVSPAVAFLVAAVTVLATAVPSAPAYVGTFELAVTAVASVFGTPPADALAWGLLAHAVTVAPLALGGVVALLVSGERVSEVIDQAEHADLAGERGWQGREP